MDSTMKESEKYEGLDWIKAKKCKPFIISGKSYVSKSHHIEESMFLIDKIRDLAKRIDKLNNIIKKYRKEQEINCHHNTARARYEVDYLEYQEPDYEV